MKHIGTSYEWWNQPETELKRHYYPGNNTYGEILDQRFNPRKGKHYLPGGNFLMRKYSALYTLSDPITITRFDTKKAFTGRLYARTQELASIVPILPDLEAVGVAEYNKIKPAKPMMNLGNALYELKDIPSMLTMKISKCLIKASGNIWLAYKFGWEPLMADVKDFLTSVQSKEKYIQQLLRDNNKPIKRRSANPTTKRVDIETYTYSEPDAFGLGLVSQCYAGPSTVTVERYLEYTDWAVALFRYWLPAGFGDPVMQERDWRRLFNLRITPANIWRAIPWSWLVNWIFNTAQVLDNLDAGVAERIIHDWAYVCRTSHLITKVTCKGSFNTSEGVQERLAISQYRLTFKERRVIFPFGLGWVPDEGISSYQAGILAALLASKGSNVPKR